MSNSLDIWKKTMDVPLPASCTKTMNEKNKVKYNYSIISYLYAGGWDVFYNNVKHIIDDIKAGIYKEEEFFMDSFELYLTTIEH